MEGQEETGQCTGLCTASGRGFRGEGVQSGWRGRRPGSEPGSRKSERSSGRWYVLVLLSEVQQWFDCNIQRPENMEAGFGEEEHGEQQW